MKTCQRVEVTMYTLFAAKVMLTLCHYYLLCTSGAFIAVSCSDFSRDDPPSGELSPYELDADFEESQLQDHQRASQRRNKKRLLTNTKLFYFLQNPRQLLTSESKPLQDQLTAKSDYNYGYAGHESPNTYKSIHIHSAQPVQYHGKSKDEFWPLLLLSFLPVLFGSLILLPLLLSFFTQVLQLLAMMQNTMNNVTTGTATLVPVGRRRRRHISKLELNYYPFGTEEMVHTLTQRLSKALVYFNSLNSS